MKCRVWEHRMQTEPLGREGRREGKRGRLASETYTLCQRTMDSVGTFMHGCKHLPLKSLLVRIFATELK